MLTTSQSAAIHCALILGLPEPEAAKLAGIPVDQAQSAIGQVDQVIRGRKIDFNRWLSGNDPVQSDPRLLFYEIQLGRLEYQHDECVRSWRRTQEHAEKLQEKFPTPLDAHNKPMKPFVGDIRFLQLAKNIRREMEKIEKFIVERIEELQKQQQTRTEPARIASLPTEAIALSDQTSKKPDLSPDSPTCISQSETIPVLKTPPERRAYAEEPATSPQHVDDELPKQANRQTAAIEFLTALHGANNSKAPYVRKTIPSIDSPPRKRDKYAGVNR